MSEKAGRRATSTDVARAAGVSRTTVSFVLNDVAGQTIPAATRAAVHAAATRLGYTPSASARALRSGRSRLVLCLAPEWDPSALMDEALTLMSRTLRGEGFAVVVAKASAVDSSAVLLSAVAPAAVVAMFDLPAAARLQLRGMHVPVVEMYLYSRQQGEVSDDLQVTVGRLQAGRLADRGCDRLVSVVPRHSSNDGVLRDRVVGARQVAEERGLPVPLVLEFDRLRDPAILRGLEELLRLGARVGVCGFNDAVAVGVIAVAREAGVAVPDDFLVVGVDDDPMAALTVPTLTTVRLDLPALDALVTNRLKRALGMPVPGSDPTGPFASLVERDSA